MLQTHHRPAETMQVAQPQDLPTASNGRQQLPRGCEQCVLLAPCGANKKSFPRGAPMQHLAPRQNPEG